MPPASRVPPRPPRGRSLRRAARAAPGAARALRRRGRDGRRERGLAELEGRVGTGRPLWCTRIGLLLDADREVTQRRLSKLGLEGAWRKWHVTRRSLRCLCPAATPHVGSRSSPCAIALPASSFSPGSPWLARGSRPARTST